MNESIDSLREEVLYASTDSARVHASYILGEKYVLSHPDSALFFYEKAIDLGLNISDSIRVAKSYVGLCDVFSMRGQYRKATEFISKALKYTGSDYKLIALCYSRFATEYYNLGQLELCLEMDKKSLIYNSLLDDKQSISFDLYNIASTFEELDQPDSARYYYNKSLQQVDSSNILYAYNHSRLGADLSNKGQLEEALSHHFKALERFEVENMTYHVALEQQRIANAFFDNKCSDKAVAYAQSSIDEGGKLNNFELLQKNYALLLKIYKKRKQFERALEYASLERAYTDSIDQKNKDLVTESLKSKFELESNQKLLEATEKNNKELARKKRLFMMVSAVALVFLCLSIVVIVLMNRANKRNKELSLKIDRVNTSIKMLLSIIGHDLRGSMSNLKNFTHLMHYKLLDKQSIENMVVKFIPLVDTTYDLLDTLLTWSNNSNDSFNPKIEELSAQEVVVLAIKHIDPMAKSKNICIKHEVEDITFKVDKNMLMTVIRNLVSNAIKFSNPDTCIKVSAFDLGSDVEFVVQDRGVGMSSEQVDNIVNKKLHESTAGTKGEYGSGIGLSLCNSFIKKHGGQLIVESTLGEGSLFKFILPKKYTHISKEVSI